MPRPVPPRPERGQPVGRDREPPYDSLENIHKDVHGLRKQLLEAITATHVATMSMLTLISTKLDKLGAGGGITPEDEAAAKRIRALAKSASDRLKILDARQ